MLTSIVGINWGDEGKGRMVDLLSADYDVVVRYQGGNNAGHTVVNERGRFVMNLLPSGVLRPETANVLGPGIVIDLEHLWGEVRSLEEAGIGISPEHLILSDRATICLPFHRLLDCLEEDRLGDRKFGSTRRGISPVYADKYMKKALRMGDLLHGESLRRKVEALLEWKNLVISGGYGHTPIAADEVMEWLECFGKPFAPYIQDTTLYLSEAVRTGKNILFEAQLGALRDIDFGIYPFTSASTTLAAYAPIGAGIPFARLDNCIGIMKAYSSCVGEGPFPCEFFGSDTSGEKTFEEFYTDTDVKDEKTFVNLGAVKNSKKRPVAEVEAIFANLRAVFRKPGAEKADVIEVLKEYLPNFQHIEKGKSLDARM